jgi:uncharacterized protein YkwD
VSSSLLGIALAASLTAPHSIPLSSASQAITSQSQQTLVRQIGSRTVADRSNDAQAMLNALNTRRASKGLTPLALDPSLTAVAFEHAADMALRSYFDHNSPEGVSPFGRMDNAHIAYGYAGENLALDQSTGAAELALWQSPEHRDNILGSHYVKVGIAAVDTTDGLIFVEDFTD